MKTRRRRFLELSDGTIMKFEQLKKVACDELLKEKPEIIRSDKYDTVYLLKDGRVLYTRSFGEYFLYNSKDQFDRILKNVADSYQQPADGPREVPHMLAGKVHYGREFPDHAASLAGSLSRAAGFSDDNFNEQVLIRIDQRICNMEDPIDFYRVHFEELIAIIGEALRTDIQATWTMKMGFDNKTWEPCITAEGRDIEFFTYLWEDIYEEQDPEKPILHEAYLTVKDLLAYKAGRLKLF